MFDEMLKKFDLQVGEIFSYRGNSYVVTRDGIFDYSKLNVDGKVYERADDLMIDMLLGNIARLKPYRPKFGEIYYYPLITKLDLYGVREWMGEPMDITLWERNMVFKAEQDAIKVAKQMLNILDNK